MKALVTGGTGFVASHIIRQLLEDGHVVNATVRNLRDESKLGALHQLQQRHGAAALTLFEADLLVDRSFDPAMRGCEVVLHVASPFKLPEKIHDGRREMVVPALSGTENVLKSVMRHPSVSRVVLTSTIGAMFGDYSDVIELHGGVLTEKQFNVTSTVDYNAYHFAKVSAETLAWEMATGSDRWSLVTINPGLVLGPTLPGASSDSGSLFLLDELISGKYFYGLPDIAFALVDVREVATAHVAAATSPKAEGRFIVAHPTMTGFAEITDALRPVHHRPFLLPRRTIPKPIMKAVGPLFGLSRKYVENHVGVRFTLDNHRSTTRLGIAYRPVTETIQDHYQAWANEHRRDRRPQHTTSVPAGQQDMHHDAGSFPEPPA